MYKKEILLQQYEILSKNIKQEKLQYINVTDYIFKYTNPDYILTFVKIKDKFKFQITTHLIDLEELKIKCKSLYILLNQLENFKTRNKDKLIIPCPRNLDDYCPICSFKYTMEKLSNIYITETVDNDLVKGVTMLANIINNSISNMNNFYIPTIIYNTSTGEISSKFLSINNDILSLISEKLKDSLEELKIDIDNVDTFSMTLNINENIKQCNIIDINLSNNNLKNILAHYLNNLKNLDLMNNMTLNKLIMAKDIEKLEQVKQLFDDIFEKFTNELNKLF